MLEENFENGHFLYHYTTLETFFKILDGIKTKGGEYFFHLHANRIDKVNDPTEMTISQKELVEVVNAYEKQHNIKSHFQIANRIKQLSQDEFNDLLIMEKKEHPPYVTCFSKKGDYLPMWSLYGEQHHGVCLCFSDNIDDIIKNYNNSQPVVCGDVTYNKYLNSPAIQESLFLNYNIKNKHETDDIKEIVSELLVELSPFLKSKDYSYENEYRICVHNYICSPKYCTEYDSKKEFISLAIPLKSLCAVYVGKKLPFDILKHLFENYFKSLNCEIEIKPSENPYK